MASTSAMFTGLSGLNSNARSLEVIGNNIANANTTAFKSNRMLFSPQFNRNFSLGSAPSGNSGGTNPGQIGLGVNVSATQRNFNNGGMSTTGIPSDLAIEGDGFFIVERAGEQFYTRDGSFQFNASNDLVTSSGARVRGYTVDENFNLIEGRLADVNIPLGVMTIAEATDNVEFSGNLNADGLLPSTGATITFPVLTDVTAGPGPATAGTLLTNLGPAGSIAVGDTFTISGAERGGKTVPDATFTVDAASDVTALMDFVLDVLGVVPQGGYQASDPADVAAEPGGWTIDAAGIVTLTSNWGELNDITLEPDNFSANLASAAVNPFVPTKTASADGESVRTTFTVYDSLGSPLEVDLTMVMAAKSNNGTFWRAFMHSSDDSDLRLHLEQGDPAVDPLTAPVFQFDTVGRLVTATSLNVEIDRDATGALDPLNFSLAFQSEGSNVTAFASPEGVDGQSTLAATFQDGSPLGVLSSFAVGNNGVITGGFTNGLTRTIGQIALANFTNAEGLVDAGNSLFSVGPNSGTPLVTTPQEFGTGRVVGGALELSNTDLSQEFINMILTQTGYSAASRVITTSDQLIQQLLVIGR